MSIPKIKGDSVTFIEGIPLFSPKVRQELNSVFQKRNSSDKTLNGGSQKPRDIESSEDAATDVAEKLDAGGKKVKQKFHKETKLERGFRFLKKIPKKIETRFQMGDIMCEGTYSPITFQGCWFNNCLKSMFHLSNPWFFHIKSGKSESHFLRTASTRGNEQATKELVICALASQYGGFDELLKLKSLSELELNLSNIQLMTPGKFSDGDIPLKQMKALQELAKPGQQPIEIKYNEKTFKVNIKPPLLFNFGVNAQHFRLGRLARSKEIDEINQKSFALLFGDDPRNIGPECFYKAGSVIEKFLNDCKEETKKKQIQALAEQIIYILQNYPNGIESNPYALPARVSVLTELLGHAVSFNCKSGKDRTSLLAMEIKLLEAELNSNKEKIVLPVPDKTTDEERKILHQLYLDEANGVVYANIGKQTLDIKEILGFNSLRDRFGANLREVLLVNELEELDKKVVEDLEALQKELKAEIRSQVAILLEKAKKKPKELTEEDREAMFSALLELDKVAINANLPKEYSDLISRIIDSAERFFLESSESSLPKKVTPQIEKSLKEQLAEELSPENPKSFQPEGSSKPSQFPMTPDMLAGVKLKPLEQSKPRA